MTAFLPEGIQIEDLTQASCHVAIVMYFKFLIFTGSPSNTLNTRRMFVIVAASRACKITNFFQKVKGHKK